MKPRYSVSVKPVQYRKYRTEKTVRDGTLENGDFALHDAVNRSLDLTIEKLGREKVQAKLDEYLKLIYVGTTVSYNVRNKPGCGIPSLHEKQQPFEGMDKLRWFDKLPIEDQKFVNEVCNRSR